jgi:hypothetical protein
MDDTFDYDALPPYPGVPFPSAAMPSAAAVTAPGQPPTGSGTSPPRRWLPTALGAGAVVLAAGAFLLGRGSAPRSPSTLPTATALSALTSATAAPATAACGTPRGVTAGTLKSVSGSTLTVTTPKGTPVTVKTDSNTKVTKVVSGSLADVTTGATVAVHGAANGTSALTADQVAVLPATGLKPLTAGPAGPAGPASPGGPGGRGAPRALAAGLAVGTVQSVSSSGFTVTSGGTTITVTTSSSTTFSKTMSAAVSDLTVGQPIAVGGTANSDGSVTAVTIEQAGTGTGLGRFPGFGIGPRPGPGRLQRPVAPGTTLPSGSP